MRSSNMRRCVESRRAPMTRTFCILAAPAIDGLTHCASIDVGREAQPETTSAAATETRQATMRLIMAALPRAYFAAASLS